MDDKHTCFFLISDFFCKNLDEYYGNFVILPGKSRDLLGLPKPIK